MTSEAKNPAVSVIIPNYNYARYLEERISSVLNQTFQDFEVILLDDASTDESRVILERYREHPKVSHIVVNTENSGSPFAQWERGMALARGRYIWIAEADDSAEPDFLEQCFKALELHPEAAIVKPMSTLIDSEGNLSEHRAFEDYEPDGSVRLLEGNELDATYMLERNYFYNASMLLFDIRKWHTLKDRSFMRYRYTGDWLFWGLLALDEKVLEVRRRLNRFRLHGKSVTDEGHNHQKGIRVRAEAYALKYRLLKELRKRGYSVPTLPIYQMHRDLIRRPDKELIQAVERLSPDMMEELRALPPLRYASLWLRKHLGLK